MTAVSLSTRAYPSVFPQAISVRYLLCACLVLLVISGCSPEDNCHGLQNSGTLTQILFIGNSYTYVNDLPGHVYQTGLFGWVSSTDRCGCRRQLDPGAARRLRSNPHNTTAAEVGLCHPAGAERNPRHPIYSPPDHVSGRPLTGRPDPGSRRSTAFVFDLGSPGWRPPVWSANLLRHASPAFCRNYGHRPGIERSCRPGRNGLAEKPHSSQSPGSLAVGWQSPDRARAPTWPPAFFTPLSSTRAHRGWAIMPALTRIPSKLCNHWQQKPSQSRLWERFSFLGTDPQQLNGGASAAAACNTTTNILTWYRQKPLTSQNNIS